VGLHWDGVHVPMKRRRVTLAGVVARVVCMRFTILAMLAMGCGTNGVSSTEGGTPDEGAPDVPIVYCSRQCGTVDASTDGAFPCETGDICGQSGGVAGFFCCNQATFAVCSPGFPGPGDCP
jgi:hypothetical protein